MRQESRQTLEHLKMQMLDATRGLPADEKEEFYNEVNEWTYQQYEEALLRQEPEMQNHEEEG